MESENQEPNIQRVYHRLLSPLSLFPRKATPPEPPKRRREEPPSLFSIPLPQLKVGPLCRQVSKRLAGLGLSARVVPEDRLRFAQVILDELKCSWQEPPAEPILDYQNNVKLRKRLESYVLISSEQLFLRYLHLLVTLPASRKVFTESATLTWLAANLARDCTLFLTSPDVYRFLLADFQTLLMLESRGVACKRPVCPPGSFKLCPIPWPHSTGFAQVPCSSLNLNYLVQLSRPQDFFAEPENDPVKELKSIPQLKSRKNLPWLSSGKKEKEIDLDTSKMAPCTPVTPTRAFPFHISLVHPQLQRGQSMPSLREGRKLADELGLPPLPLHPLTPLILAPDSKPDPTVNPAAEDLKQKMKHMVAEWTCYSQLDSCLPPLLGVLTRQLASEHHMEDLKKMLKSLQEEEASGQWHLQPSKSPPLHPQPVTITLKLKKPMVVQIASLRFSDRCFADSFQVEGARVLYNHLIGELDDKVIQELDAKHFIGSSTKEVYKELMSRVATDHFRFDQGPLIEPAPNRDWSSTLSSTLPRHNKKFQVINPNLTGFYSRKINVQQSHPRKRSSISSLQRNRKRSVWRNSESPVEDYFKHLAKQDTDFLHVIFQLYQEEAPAEPPAPAKESLDIQNPPPFMEDEEPDFVPGEWNWSTVIDEKPVVGRVYIANLQKHLERLWSMLEVPDKSRLEMAIKYSSSARLQQLPALIKAWERALKPIQMRELLMGRLEWFERQASDPNRLFQKPDVIMNQLLEEAQYRNQLHRKLKLMEPSLVALLEKIESVFGEPVTFKGWRYLDKMKQDKVQMLYWLQQQRRIRHLIRAQKAFNQSSLFLGSKSPPLLGPGNTPITL